MRNPFRERNLMSARDNPYMQAYRENPARVREILETARHSTVPDRQDVKNWIVMSEVIDGELMSRLLMSSICAPMVSMIGGFVTKSMPYSVASGVLLTIGLSTHYITDFYKQRQRLRGYNLCKEQADGVLGYKRVEGSPQLEFLFD